MRASLSGCVETVNTLLQLGADHDIIDAYGRPALWYAIVSGVTELTERLAEITTTGEISHH